MASAFEATWPAARYVEVGGFRLGLAEGAGRRVNSAYAASEWQQEDIDLAIRRSLGEGCAPAFRVMDGDAPLTKALAGRGFRPETPTAIMAAEITTLTDQDIPPVTAFAIWPPLAIQRDIWTACGIGPARQQVMQRAVEPKAALLGRTHDRAAAVGFVAVHQHIGMVHAVETLPDWRRNGMAGWMMRRAAEWAADNGADRLALAVTRGNAAALALYGGLGFAEVAGYAYYCRP